MPTATDHLEPVRVVDPLGPPEALCAESEALHQLALGERRMRVVLLRVDLRLRDGALAGLSGTTCVSLAMRNSIGSMPSFSDISSIAISSAASPGASFGGAHRVCLRQVQKGKAVRRHPMGPA